MKYEISRKRKSVFEWTVNILHAYNISFALAFKEPTGCLSLTTYCCMYAGNQIKFFGPGYGVEKWARIKVQIIHIFLFYLGLKRSDI